MEHPNEVRNLRTQRGIRVADIVEKIGMKEGAFRRIERGEVPIRGDVLQKIAAELSVSVEEVLGGEPKVQPPAEGKVTVKITITMSNGDEHTMRKTCRADADEKLSELISWAMTPDKTN